MAEEPQRRFETKEIVKKQLEARIQEHLQILMKALGKSHPDLATIQRQDEQIQVCKRSLEYLDVYYPKGGYVEGELVKAKPTKKAPD